MHKSKLKMDERNISHNTIKVLEKNIGKFQIVHAAIFSVIGPLEQGI